MIKMTSSDNAVFVYHEKKKKKKKKKKRIPNACFSLEII